MSRWLITGAASGIGAAMVQAVSAQGDTVWALDIAPSEDLDGVQPAICDVSNPNEWQTVVAQMGAAGDLPLDFVHLNAGIQIAPPQADMAEYQFEAASVERYRKMMGVNVDGVVFGLQALLPHLSEGSAVVVTASLAGVVPYEVDPLYAMSKHAVVGLVRSLGPSLAARGIRLNAFCPGGIDTAIIPHAQREGADPALFMTPAHVAEEVIRLMHTDSSGKSWAKVRQDKPMFIIRAPGDKSSD